MKGVLLILGLAGVLAACDNKAGSGEIKLDSLKDKFERSAEKTMDSVEKKGKVLIEKLKDKLDTGSERADTIK
jgi:hypothetical protein